MTTIAAAVNEAQRFIETIDPEDPQYRRELQRPAEVKEDMRQMESRQRVSSILNSQAFREELESIIADQLKHGPHPASVLALQQISELLLPTNGSRWHQVSSMGRVGSNQQVIPINDVRSVDSLSYSKGERLIRCKLASLFRLIDLFGWSSPSNSGGIITVRLNQELDNYLINPFGLLLHEITASSLIKIDINGEIVDGGSTTYNINKSLFNIQSAVYKTRPDIKCILHVQTPSTTAISSLKCGLLQISRESILCGNISYHEYKGSDSYLNENYIKSLLCDDLGPLNKIMFIRNYGVLIFGETIEESWYYLCNCISACESQLRIMSAGLDNLYLPNDELKKRIIQNSNSIVGGDDGNGGRKWKLGEIEFEACMRCLDNAAYRTGYIYRQPISRNIDRNAIKEVEIPPTCSSINYDDDYIKKLKDFKGSIKTTNGGDWLNTPNGYTKHEELEGFNKKTTKWLPETSPNSTNTPIRIDNKNQFAPLSVDPKELKNQQKQIKQDRFVDKITPGHQSKILENISVVNGDNNNNEGQQQNETSFNLNGHFSKEKHGGSGTIIPNGVQEALLLNNSHNSPSKTVVYGAASKGIIKRDQQNNSIVYKSFQSTPNPFQQMDKQDIEKYKKEVEQSKLREQVQRKEDMHKELLDKSTPSTINEQQKTKSHTMPRSRSLLEKKNDENVAPSSPEQSRENTPKKTSAIESPQQTPTINKSATLSTSTASQQLEPKKKSKSKFRSFSFLKSKKSSKSNDQTQ